MADDGNVLSDLDGATNGNGADNQPVAGLISQYIKDLSVENPKAPESFQWRDQPELDVQFNIAAEAMNEEVSEVELKITVTSKTQQGVQFIVDLSYCGLIGMRNIAEEQKHAFTFAEAPRLLFPFARRVIGDATRDAGFAPVMLDPIDFNGLYLQRLQQKRAEEAGDTGAPDAGEA